MTTETDRLQALYDRSGQTRGGTKRSGAPAWFARAIGVNRATLTKWGESNWPPYAVLILTLLERLPVERWPDHIKASGSVVEAS